MIQTIQARKHSEALRDALNSFSDWQNRPINRVHCYTWPLAVKLFPGLAAQSCLRIVRAYRHLYPATVVLRRRLAEALKLERKAGKITLPVYDERSAKWIQAPPLRFVTREQACAEGFNFRTKTNNPKSLHTVTQQLRNEGYTQTVIVKQVFHTATPAGTAFLFFVKHPAINP